MAAGQSTSNVDKAEVDSDDDDEFVYDLYYKADHPQSNSAAGSLSPTGAFDDVSSLAGLQRIGELAGLDEDEILNDELSSEEEDEADQDSNGEYMQQRGVKRGAGLIKLTADGGCGESQTKATTATITRPGTRRTVRTRMRAMSGPTRELHSSR